MDPILIIVLAVGALALIGLPILLKDDPVRKARRLEMAGRLPEAQAAYHQALEKLPDNAFIVQRIAEISEQRSDWMQAGRFYQRLLETEGGAESVDRTLVRRRLAACRYHAKDYRGAFLELQGLERERGLDAESFARMGLICLKMGALPEARGHLERAYASLRGNFEIAYALSVCLARLEEYEAALRLFGEAEAAAPQEIRVPLLSGIAAYLARQPMRTADSLQRVVDTPQADTHLRYIAKRVLGFSLLSQERYEEANRSFAELLSMSREARLDAAALEALMDLGCARAASGDAGGALAAWNELARINPDYPHCRTLIEAAEAARGDKTDGGTPSGATLADLLGSWQETSITPLTLWGYSGLAEAERFDIQALLGPGAEHQAPQKKEPVVPPEWHMDQFQKSDRNAFEKTVRRIVATLGYAIIDQLKRTDRGDLAEGDGLDLITTPINNRDERTYIQARKWHTGTGQLGDMSLKNLLGRMPELRCTKGILLTTAELSPAAAKFAEKNPALRIVHGEELAGLIARAVG
jgi:tetratricopeptide (TPR) repeat protein